MSDRNQYERVMAALHSVANDLTEIDSRERICRRTIEAAEHLLDFDFSIIALEDDGMLRPAAVSTEMSIDEYDTMSIHDGIAGETYRTERSFLIEDTTKKEMVQGETPWRSIISLPVGQHGNFQAVDEAVGAFGEQDLRLAELLVTHTANHLDRVAAKESLEEQNERLNEFASIVSHDLRNPLNVATGHLELAASECDTEHIDEVERALSRMENLIDTLLVLARQGESISETQSVSLDSVVDASWSNVSVGEATINGNTGATIKADRDRVGQLLENLFRNAIDHGGENVT
ncbi:MAG: sensor histidine kinase, partial [archaeon]